LIQLFKHRGISVEFKDVFYWLWLYVKYCCLFWYVLFFGIKLYHGWDKSFKIKSPHNYLKRLLHTFTTYFTILLDQAVYASQVGQDQTAVWMWMNVSGQHLLAVEFIQPASMYRAASAVSVNLDSTITPAFVSVRICVYLTQYTYILHLRSKS